MSSDQTNIYGKYFFQRWWAKVFGYGKPLKLPKPHFADDFEQKMGRLKAWAVSWRKGDRKSMVNILAAGEPGVGKTLFCKTLAQDTGLKYVYFTPGDLAQLDESAALEELKKMLRFCKKSGPCLLLFDEIDQLFESGSKNRLLQGMFQSEFQSGIGDNVCLIGLTNYPERISPAVLDRLPLKIFFPPPNFEVQKKILAQTIERFEGDKIDLGSLKQTAFKGLSGREVEAIAFNCIEIDGSLSAAALFKAAEVFSAEKRKSKEVHSAAPLDLLELEQVLKKIEQAPVVLKTEPERGAGGLFWMLALISILLCILLIRGAKGSSRKKT